MPFSRASRTPVSWWKERSHSAIRMITALLFLAFPPAWSAANDDNAAGLLLTPCMEGNEIILSRVHELSVFGPAVGNSDTLTDSYRVFPFHLFRPANVRVALVNDRRQPEEILIAEKKLASGSYFFVLTYQDVAALAAERATFTLGVQARGGNGAGQPPVLQSVLTPGLLLEKRSGDVLGKIVEHDVMIDRGRLTFSRDDLTLTGRGPDFGFTRHYSNQDFDRRLYSTLGPGWCHNHERFLHVIAWGDDYQPFNLPKWVAAAKGRYLPLASLPTANERPRYVWANGVHFKRVKEKWVAACTFHGSLEEKKDGFTFISKDGTAYFYSRPKPRDMAAVLKTILASGADKPKDPTSPLAALRYTSASAWPLGYIQDRNGNRLTPEYAQTCIGPVVTAVTDAVGRRLAFEYDPPLSQHPANEIRYNQNPFRLRKVIGPDGIVMTYHYAPGTRLLNRFQRDVHSEAYDYAPCQDPKNLSLPQAHRSYNLERVTDANGNSRQYAYCAPRDIPPVIQGHVAALNPFQAVKTVRYPDMARAVFAYDDTAVNQRTVSDPRGYPTTYILSANGNPLKRIAPLGKVDAWTWQLDDVRNDIIMTTQTDVMGRVTHYEYDLQGNISREKSEDGDVIVNRWLPEYSALLSKTVNGHVVEQNRYDARGNLIENIDEEGRRTRYVYNQRGEQLQKEEHDGRVTRYAYDPRGNLKNRASGDDETMEFEYDIRGRLVGMTASDGRRWSYVYDTLDRRVEAREPNKPNLKNVYDPKGNVIEETNGDRPPIHYAYDACDRTVRVTTKDKEQQITYDANGNVLTVIDESGDTTTHTYNALNERIVAEAAARGMDLRYKGIYDRLITGLTLPSGLSAASWDNRQKALKAGFLNRKGVFFYNRDNYELAVKYFTQAVELSNHSVSFLRNSMDAFHKLERYREALVFLEKHGRPYSRDEELRSWHAWYLAEAGRAAEAVAVYDQLFAGGYRSEEDLEIYTDLLYDLGRHDDIDKAFSGYLKGGRSEIVLLAQSKSFYKRKQYTAALKILDDLQKSKSFDPAIAHEMILNYSMLRQYGDVRRICLKLIDGGYASADAYYYKGDAEYQMQWLPEAKKSLERALLLAPEDKKIKSYIDHVSGRLGQGDNTHIKQKIDPVPIPPAFAAMQNKQSSKPDTDGAEAYYRRRLKCFRFTPGAPLTYTLHRDIRIVNAAGVAAFSTLKYPFNPLYETIHVNKLVVKDKKGKTIAAGNPDDYYVMDAQPDDMAAYDQILYLPVPNLEPGNTIELMVSVQTKGACSRFPFKREALFCSHPIQFGGLFVQGESDTFAYQSANIGTPRKRDNGLLWTVANQPAYQWEPEQVDYERYMPMVFLSAARQDWEAVGSGYRQDIASRLTLDEETRRTALSVTKGAAAKEEKIRRLTAFVQKTLTYKPIEFGVRGAMPNTPSESLAKKYGDCKDHSVLLRQLLTALDIPAQLALVDTQWSIVEALPSTDQFNHMIVRVDGYEIPWYIDATDKGMPLDSRAPMGLAGRQALVLEPGQIRLDRLPPYDREFCRVYSRRTVSILEDKDLSVTETVRFHGYYASHLRSMLKPLKTDDQTSWFETAITRFYPEIEIRSMEMENLYDNEKELVVTLRYLLKETCEQLAGQVFVKIPGVWEQYYLKVQQMSRRRTDFEIVYPLVFDSQVIFQSPPGYDPTAAKTHRQNIVNAFCSWRTEMKDQADSVNLTFSLQLKTGVFPADKYHDYQKAMDQAIKSVNQKIVLRKQKDRP